MRYISCDHPQGTIIVPTSGTPRFTEFYRCMERVEVPGNSRLLYAEASDLTAGLNKACEQILGDWVWFMGDDHTFEVDALMRLLNHRLPAVVPLNIQRVSPFKPVILKGATIPECKPIAWSDVPTGDGLWYPPAQHYVGNAGLLIRKVTLDAIPKPIFRCGQFDPGRLNEDLWLMSQLGPVPVDLSVRLGHINNFAAVPTVQDGKWWVTFQKYGQVAFATEAI